MKQKKKNKHGENFLYLVLVIAVIGFFLLANKSDQTKAETNNSVSIEEQIVRELAAFPELQSYANYTAFVKLITEDDLQQLKQQQPAIYEDVKEGTYMVVYQGPSDSLLVIYDFEKKEILKIFAVQTLVI